MDEGVSAKGIFGGTASAGRAFSTYRRRSRLSAVDRFAELISVHDDVRKVASLMGITYPNACKIMNRLARQLNADEDLGWTPPGRVIG